MVISPTSLLSKVRATDPSVRLFHDILTLDKVLEYFVSSLDVIAMVSPDQVSPVTV
jgi:hypothetical protein